jgi:hypothetical protein
MSDVERTKLYKAIPGIDYAYTPPDPFFGDRAPFDLDKEMIKRFKYYLSILRKHIPIEIRRSQISRVYDEITQSSRNTAVLFLTLFADEDLSLTDENKREAILLYWINLLGNANPAELSFIAETNYIRKLSKYFNNPSGAHQIEHLVYGAYPQADVKRKEFLSVLSDLTADIEGEPFNEVLEALTAMTDEKTASRFQETHDIPF